MDGLSKQNMSVFVHLFISGSFTFLQLIFKFGHRRMKISLRAYAKSEGPDKPAHLHSLFKASIVHLQNHCR